MLLWRLFGPNLEKDVFIQPWHTSETWQLISANINRENSANVEQVVGTHSVADYSCFATDNVMGCGFFLSLSVFVFYGCRFGSTTLPVSDQICNVQKSWRSEERCTAVLFGSVMVLCARDSAKH